MSTGTLTQLIASGGGQASAQFAPTVDTTSNNTTSQPTYVCLNDVCLLNNPALFGSMPAFASLEECQKVCGVKPSTLRPQ